MSPDLQQPINASTDAGSSSPLPSAPPRGAGEKLSFLQIYNRLMRLRANRRRIGPFDWSPLSWDSDTTRRRAVRIHLRLHGVREPLYSVHRDDRAVPWNAYHG
jgi:hypothetical protein